MLEDVARLLGQVEKAFSELERLRDSEIYPLVKAEVEATLNAVRKVIDEMVATESAMEDFYRELDDKTIELLGRIPREGETD